MKFRCPLSLEENLETMLHSLILILTLHQLFSVILTLSRNSFRKLLETAEPFLSIPWFFIPFKLNLLCYYYCIIVLVTLVIFKCLYFFWCSEGHLTGHFPNNSLWQSSLIFQYFPSPHVAIIHKLENFLIFVLFCFVFLLGMKCLFSLTYLAEFLQVALYFAN